MTTASTIVNDALRIMGVASDILAPSPEQQSKGFTVLSGMIAEWVEDEIDIVIVQPYDTTDDIGESSHMTESIKALLAKRLAGYLQIDLEDSAEKMAEFAMDRLLKYAPDPDIIYPDNLPKGQGNYRLYTSPFFGDSETNQNPEKN